MAFELYTLDAIKTGTAGGTIIGDITAQDIEVGVELAKGGGSSQLSDRFVTIMKQRSKITFTTQAIKKVLDLLGTTGFAIDDAADTLILYWKKRAPIGDAAFGTGFDATGHMSVTADDGVIAPLVLKGKPGELASLDCELQVLSPDGSDPIAIAAGASLPTYPATQDGLYRMESVVIGGVAIDQVEGVTVNFGLALVVSGDDGAIYPRGVALMKHEPTFQVETKNLGLAHTLVGDNMHGQVTSAASTIDFREKVLGAGDVAAGAELRLSIAKSFVSVDNWPGSNDEDATVTLNVAALKTGVDIMTMDTELP